MEVEAKFKVDSHEPVRQRLRDLNARPDGAVIETNCLFDNHDQLLWKSDRGLRLRTCRDASGRVVAATLTVKGPQLPGELKRREEIETRVDDPVAAGQILESIGFQRVVQFEKRRESWTLKGCRVELDEVPFLGAFIEIEGTENEIGVVRGLLGLHDATLIRETYIALLAGCAAERGISMLELHF